MSGLEVAGVVLGAFPLAIAALDRRRDLARRLNLWQAIRPEYFSCKTDLGFHRATLTSNLRQLLLPLVVDDTTINQLLADPGGEGWKDPSIDNLLRDRLGEKYELYFEYIKGMEMVMHEVREELAADSDAVQEKLNTPVSSIAALVFRA
ncbi:hypothetical protein IMZ48_40465 [Candidatus Bathyarchaeota archaeon]|nr:hypothetical protein [Candidatus Bathyarchaeota archaeon]